MVLSQEIRAQINNGRQNNDNKKSNDNIIELSHDTYKKPDWKKIDVDFLSSYYQQDGNNSPVTGGIGTEYLTDFTQKLLVNIPLNERLNLKLDGGYDYYSSASTDNIDNIKSSDSAQDMRTHGSIGIEYLINDQHSFGARWGGSVEYDYISIQGGFNYLFTTKNRNTNIGINAQAFIDTWALYYPQELTGQGELLPTDKRNSYNVGLVFNQVLNKRNQLAIMLEGTYMNGLLSTPFHRVYFKENTNVKVERLPDTRLKIPMAVRLNSYITDWLISRAYYRYYYDDWKLQAHTASLELAIKLNRFFWISPHYRFNTQTAAEYFKPYKEHSVKDNFYSSDYDLASHSSHAYGIAISYQPAKEIGHLKIPFSKQSKLSLKSIDLKISRYHRSTGLIGNIVSLGMGFNID